MNPDTPPTPHPQTRRLIEEWLPINELSVEAIRERAGAVPNPAPHQLHVWWARRPLAPARAAVAASLLRADADHAAFIDAMGTYVGVCDDQQALADGVGDGYAKRRAFTHNLTPAERAWLHDNLAPGNPAPLVLDITAGGGSIPFEAGRLGFRSYANDLNPVAALILRATCQWPQTYGRQLLEHYGRPITTTNGVPTGEWTGIAGRFLARVRTLLDGVYPPVPQPEWMAKWNSEHKSEIKNSRIVRAQRYAWASLWARTIQCPSCNSEIPLSPNWRLNSKGTGVRVLPQETATHPDGIRRCDFEIVDTVAEQSPGTVKSAIATCPWPECGATTPRDYIAGQAQTVGLGHRLYAIIYRSHWQGYTKAGRPKKRLNTRRDFAIPAPGDDNSAAVQEILDELLPQWDDAGILPDETLPPGDKTKEPHRYGMPDWSKIFSPRQQLAMGSCVKAFRELVDADAAAGELNEVRKAAWCYLALALDKLLNRNNLLTRWDSGKGKEIVVGTFDSHDFGMKWSYADMTVAVWGYGLDWAMSDVHDHINDLIGMSGHPQTGDDADALAADYDMLRARSTDAVTTESADFLLSLADRAVDALVFDPPYYDNVSYAELSDFFYVWLKRTAGYVRPEWFGAYLTDKGNEAIASPARFRNDAPAAGGPNRRGNGGSGSVKRQAYEDYVARMRRIFAECRRVIKDDGIVTVMFTHKSTDAWDALTIGIIDAGFRITATWPVKTESDSALNIRDRAAARSTILLVCRPQTRATRVDQTWEPVEQEIADRVRERIPILESYGLRPLDIYLAAFGPALEVISTSWPIRRAMANPQRPDYPFLVTPNDALQVARREVFAARRRKISDRWANNPGDPLTEFYILAQDSAGSARMPFDEANMVARCVGIELTDTAARQIYAKRGSGGSGGDIRLLTAQERFASGYISEQAPTTRSIDQAHTAIALAASRDVNRAIEWCRYQGFREDAAFRGTLEALLRIMKTGDPDRIPARTLWSEMYGETPPEPEGIQPELFAAG